MSRTSRPDKNELLRRVHALKPYPAVFWPLGVGGWDVIFPNFPRLRAYGADQDQAEANAVEALNAELQNLLNAGEPPPAPSDPARLIPDEDEPAGTQLLLLSPDRKVILRRLGLERPVEHGQAMAASLGRLRAG